MPIPHFKKMIAKNNPDPLSIPVATITLCFLPIMQCLYGLEAIVNIYFSLQGDR
jgi:hypothetical protein